MCMDCGLDTVVVKLLLKDSNKGHSTFIVPPNLLGYGLLGSYGFG